jgi:hypothetical protein
MIIAIPVIHGSTNSINSKNIKQLIDLNARLEIALPHGVKKNIFVVFGMLEPAKPDIGGNDKLGTKAFCAPEEFTKIMGIKQVNKAIGQKFIHPHGTEATWRVIGKYPVRTTPVVEI